MAEMKLVRLESIDLEASPQARAGTDDATVEEYAEVMRQPDGAASFPPVVLFQDADGTTWLADGWHRVRAAALAGLDAIRADVRPGSRRDALRFSFLANATHGLRRTNADKRRAVKLALVDEEWGKWSDHAIAKLCGVSQPFVGTVRSALTDNGYQSWRVGLDGRTINTGNIGKEPANAVGPDWVRVKGITYQTPYTPQMAEQTGEELDIVGPAWESFKASVRRGGFLQPIHVDHEGIVIDGRQRLRAAAELDIDPPPAVVRTDRDGWGIWNACNVLRKSYTPEEIDEAHRRLREMAVRVAVAEGEDSASLRDVRAGRMEFDENACRRNEAT